MSANDLDQIPEGDLSGLPAGAPPDESTIPFENPEDRGMAYIVVAVVFMSLATIFVLIRLWARFVVQKKPWWDDLVTVIALLCQGAYCGLNIWLCLHGVGEQIWNVYLTDFLAILEPAQVMGIVTEPAIGFTKLALLLFFCRLFWPDRTTRIGSLVGIGLVTVIYTTLFFCFIFLTLDDIARCNQAMAILNIFTDIYILLLPIPAVLGLHLPPKKKWGLVGLFSTGFLCCVLSLVGAYYRWGFSEDLSNFTWDLWAVILVNTIECSVGIMCACVPLIPAVLKHYQLGSGWNTTVRSAKKSYATGHTKRDATKNYSRVKDDHIDSIEMTPDGRSFHASASDKSLVDPPPAARHHPSRGPSTNATSVRHDAYGPSPNAGPPPMGIEVRRDWRVDMGSSQV